MSTPSQSAGRTDTIPLPWIAIGPTVYAANQNVVADFADRHPSRDTARLVAAAPHLLEAAKLALACLNTSSEFENHPASQKLRASILRVEGSK